MLPLPPLDGGRVLVGLLPVPLASIGRSIEPFGFIILIVLLMTRTLDHIIDPPTEFLLKLYLRNLLDSGKLWKPSSAACDPPGQLHLGHFHGALVNWLRLQEQYQCYFFVADWHALTTDYATPQGIQREHHRNGDGLAAQSVSTRRSRSYFASRGSRSTPSCTLLYSMITPVPWLERNPTYKEQMKEIVGKDLSTYGFLGYPVLQAADITIYKANKVPVGVDQAPHVELTREIVRRFNQLYRPIFPEPEVSADRDAEGARAGRPQDEQELRQRGVSIRHAEGDRSQSSAA